MVLPFPFQPLIVNIPRRESLTPGPLYFVKFEQLFAPKQLQVAQAFPIPTPMTFRFRSYGQMPWGRVKTQLRYLIGHILHYEAATFKKTSRFYYFRADDSHLNRVRYLVIGDDGDDWSSKVVL